MSEMEQENPQSSAWGDRVRALKNVPPVLHIVWESGPSVVTWGIILRFVVAFMPVVLGRVSAWILNGVDEVLRHQPLRPYFWWVVALEVALAVFTGMVTRLIDYSDNLLADRYTQHVSIEVMRQAARSI